VVVEVHDGSTDVPFARHPEAWEVSGRGLALIDAICERWGVRETTHGKIVWARLSIAPHRGGSWPADA
jgi:hypothetical protein